MDVYIADGVIAEKDSFIYVQFLRKCVGLYCQLELLYKIRCTACPCVVISGQHFVHCFQHRIGRLRPFFFQRVLKVSHQRISILGEVYLLLRLIASDDIQYSDIIKAAVLMEHECAVYTVQQAGRT